MSGNWDKEVDVLVVGSGAGGMLSALVAAKNHADVLIVEKGSAVGRHFRHFRARASGFRQATRPLRRVRRQG
jgi:flavin-dependent dehydrogenase